MKTLKFKTSFTQTQIALCELLQKELKELERLQKAGLPTQKQDGVTKGVFESIKALGFNLELVDDYVFYLYAKLEHHKLTTSDIEYAQNKLAEMLDD